MLRYCLAAALGLVALAAAAPGAVEARASGHSEPDCPRVDPMRPCQGATVPDRAPQRARGALIRSGRGVAVSVASAHPGPPQGAGRSDHRSSGLHALVDAAAAAAGVPLAIAHAVIRQESNYIPSTRGSAGEWGLGQIKCPTARGLGFSGPCGALADPATNLRYAMAYLRLALARGGVGCVGVSLYQRGVYGRAGCSAYGRAVMARAGR